MSNRLIRTVVLVVLGMLLISLPLVGCDEDEEITITSEQLTQGIVEQSVAAARDIETYHCDYKQTGEINDDFERTEYAILSATSSRHHQI